MLALTKPPTCRLHQRIGQRTHILCHSFALRHLQERKQLLPELGELPFTKRLGYGAVLELQAETGRAQCPLYPGT